MLYLLTRGKKLVQFDLKSLAVSAEVIKVLCGANGHGLIRHSIGILYYVNYGKEFRLSMRQLNCHSTNAGIWVLRHSICTNDMLDKNPGILHALNPLASTHFLTLFSLFTRKGIYSYHLEIHKCEHFWWTKRCMDWRYDFVYPVSYNYVNVKTFARNDTTRDVKSAHVSGDFYGKQVSGHDVIDQR
ncbi:hypothetical protein MKX03_001750 [Papaver bracteatum]|nr:hypothetical protein MKX03_001750 [Papaver bracteatum]